MKMVLFVTFWFLLAGKGYCQPAGEQPTSNKVSEIPLSETYSTSDIARFMKANYPEERERFHAIYTWVTKNIRYDTDSMYTINWNMGKEAKITEALRRRKGVCENFAAIFNDIAVRSGLTSFVVDGYTKQAGMVDKTGHSWCAVYLEGKWLLCDPTWDKDAMGQLNFFLVHPDDFINSHMPFDPIWQMQEQPLTHAEFINGLSLKKGSLIFNYADSLKAFSRLSELERLESAARRMQHTGKMSELVKNRIAYTQMQIGIFYEDADMKFYNGAVSDLNSATLRYNEFINYRNKQFLPAKEAAYTKNLLEDALEDILAGRSKISRIGLIIPNHQYDFGQLKHNMDMLEEKIHSQQEFVKRYQLSDEQK